MLPFNDDASFGKLIEALKSTDPITIQYREAVQQFPACVFERNEGPIPDSGNKPATVSKLIDEGIIMEDEGTRPMRRIRTLAIGVQDLKWSLWPHGPRNLGSGEYGSIQLIFKAEDMDNPFLKRRMAALKVQSLTDANAAQLWTEMSILSCVQHKNIVDYYGAFVVTPKTGNVYQAEKEKVLHANSLEQKAADDADKDKHQKELVADSFCILMEYANAGTLRTEILRYPNRHLTEVGARHYMKELIDGVSHLHWKNIAHGDLHGLNVVLKYNRDGKTKRCLICDFGICKLPMPVHGKWRDVTSLRTLMSRMVKGYPDEEYAPPDPPVLSSDATDVINNRRAKTCADFRQIPWFDGEAVAPVVGLLQDESILSVLPNPDSPTRSHPTTTEGQSGSKTVISGQADAAQGTDSKQSRTRALSPVELVVSPSSGSPTKSGRGRKPSSPDTPVPRPGRGTRSPKRRHSK